MAGRYPQESRLVAQSQSGVFRIFERKPHLHPRGTVFTAWWGVVRVLGTYPTETEARAKCEAFFGAPIQWKGDK